MANRNARSHGTQPPWASLAYTLWRRKHLGYDQIARHLGWEGWDVTPSEVADAVMAVVAVEISRRFGEGSRKPGGPR